MTLGLFYVLLSTSTKIFAGKNFRKSVQTREKHENLLPVKLTGYTVCPDVLPWAVSMSYANPINTRIVNCGQAQVLNASCDKAELE